MSLDFISRMIGLVIFAVVGARFGAENAPSLNLTVEYGSLLFGLVGTLFGIVITPWITVRPVRFMRRTITEWTLERLTLSLVGATTGLLLALLAAYPLSLLPSPLGNFIPAALTIAGAYLGFNTLGVRSKEVSEILNIRMGGGQNRRQRVTERSLILDTSVLIDGRIADIAETGFLGGMLVVPRFVLSELHRVADSSDMLRRNRGRRGLNMLNKLQRNDAAPVRIIDDDFDDITAVDDKLVALALQMDASLVTNDYNLNRVADAQGVDILNINELANAVRTIYIPGETFALRIIQEGTDHNQGVGYLEDGTMVVVENGKKYMDRTIEVEVTKLINRPTGRMIFAEPADTTN